MEIELSTVPFTFSYQDRDEILVFRIVNAYWKIL